MAPSAPPREVTPGYNPHPNYLKYPKTTPAPYNPSTPFGSLGSDFGCAKPGELAQVDAEFVDPVGTVVQASVDITDCGATVASFSNADAERLLTVLCDIAQNLDPTCQCRIASVAAPTAPVRMVDPTTDSLGVAERQLVGVRLICQFIFSNGAVATLFLAAIRTIFGFVFVFFIFVTGPTSSPSA